MGFPDSWYRICLQCRRPRFDSWIGKIRWRRDRLPTPVFLGFPCGSAGKESAYDAGDLSLILGLGRSPGEGKLFQYSGLENPMNCLVRGVAKSLTQLSDFHFLSEWRELFPSLPVLSSCCWTNNKTDSKHSQEKKQLVLTHARGGCIEGIRLHKNLTKAGNFVLFRQIILLGGIDRTKKLRL